MQRYFCTFLLGLILIAGPRPVTAYGHHAPAVTRQYLHAVTEKIETTGGYDYKEVSTRLAHLLETPEEKREYFTGVGDVNIAYNNYPYPLRDDVRDLVTALFDHAVKSMTYKNRSTAKESFSLAFMLCFKTISLQPPDTTKIILQSTPKEVSYISNGRLKEVYSTSVSTASLQKLGFFLQKNNVRLNIEPQKVDVWMNYIQQIRGLYKRNKDTSFASSPAMPSAKRRAEAVRQLKLLAEKIGRDLSR